MLVANTPKLSAKSSDNPMKLADRFPRLHKTQSDRNDSPAARCQRNEGCTSSP